jgi:hypothetical protein
LVDRALRRDERHEVRAPAVRPHRQPAADDLAEHREVGRDAVARLRAAVGNAEAGDDLVEHEERTVPGGRRAQARQVTGRRRHDSNVRCHRLDDDRGHVAGRQEPLDSVEVVVRRYKRVARRASRDTGAGRHAGCPRSRLDEERVGVAVVATGHLHDPVAAGRRPRESNSAHGRLRPRRDEAQALDRGHRGDDQLGQLDLAGRGRAIASSALRSRDGGGDD